MKLLVNQKRIRMIQLVVRKLLHKRYSVEYILPDDKGFNDQYFMHDVTPEAVGFNNRGTIILYFPFTILDANNKMYLCQFQNEMEKRVRQILDLYFNFNSGKKIEALDLLALKYDISNKKPHLNFFYIQTRRGKVYGKKALTKFE